MKCRLIYFSRTSQVTFLRTKPFWFHIEQYETVVIMQSGAGNLIRIRTPARQHEGIGVNLALSCSEQPKVLLLVFSAAFVFLALGWVCWIGTKRSKSILPFKESPFVRK